MPKRAPELRSKIWSVSLCRKKKGGIGAIAWTGVSLRKESEGAAFRDSSVTVSGVKESSPRDHRIFGAELYSTPASVGCSGNGDDTFTANFTSRRFRPVVASSSVTWSLNWR